MEFIEDVDLLLCPGCLAIGRAPSDIGDRCVCGENYVRIDVVREWKRVFDDRQKHLRAPPKSAMASYRPIRGEIDYDRQRQW